MERACLVTVLERYTVFEVENDNPHTWTLSPTCWMVFMGMALALSSFYCHVSMNARKCLKDLHATTEQRSARYPPNFSQTSQLALLRFLPSGDDSA